MQAWAGQAAALARAEPAGEFVLRLWEEAEALQPGWLDGPAGSIGAAATRLVNQINKFVCLSAGGRWIRTIGAGKISYRSQRDFLRSNDDGASGAARFAGDVAS